MSSKEIIRICATIFSVCSLGIMFMGFFKMKKAASMLQVGKEVSKETKELSEKGLRLIKLGGILTCILGTIAITS